MEPNHNKVFKGHPAKDNQAGEKLIDEANGFEWQLPAHSYKYTSVSDVTPKEGIFDETIKMLEKRIDRSLKLRAKGRIEIGMITFSEEYGILCKTEKADNMLEKLK